MNLATDWANRLQDEFSKDYFKNLQLFLKAELKKKQIIYPPEQETLSALNLTSLKNCKIVILGQDPYHGAGQAHGLSFSVKPGIKTPPSLRNIYKELSRDPLVDFAIPEHGFLEAWAKQGVLMLNAVLTVQAKNAGSHQQKGWEQFTDRIIEILNQYKQHLVFMLWGSHAQKKGSKIDRSRHLVLQTTHPSPFSAHKGFLGCGHFSKANKYLTEHSLTPINWQLPMELT